MLVATNITSYFPVATKFSLVFAFHYTLYLVGKGFPNTQKMSQPAAKDKLKGVQWFRHFPIGPTVLSPTDETIWNRLQTFNCVLLQRPRVGISELACSIQPNLVSLLTTSSSVINESAIKSLIEKLQPLLNALKPLEKASGIDIEEKYVVNMLKEFFREDHSSLDVINEAFIAGSTLYTMAIQYMAARAIFCNPEQYARVLPMNTTGGKAFKDNPSVKGMKRFLVSNVLTDNTGRSPSKNTCCSLLAELESSDGDSSGDGSRTASPPSHDSTPQKPKKAKKRPVDSVQKTDNKQTRKRKKCALDFQLVDVETKTAVSKKKNGKMRENEHHFTSLPYLFDYVGLF